MSTTSVQKLLSDIQQKLDCPKSQFNSFGKYNYRNCEDILQAVKPLLGEAFITINDDITVAGDRVYVKATAMIVLGKETVSTTAFAREPLTKKGMDESQITGAASSYARKYALNGLLLIDDNKDADHGAGFALDDTAKQWVMAVKQNPDVINQIEDPAYRKFIQENVK